MRPVVVALDDPRIQHFAGAYPELKYGAASLLRLLLEEAEAKGRADALVFATAGGDSCAG